jgi:hypothetical protein
MMVKIIMSEILNINNPKTLILVIVQLAEIELDIIGWYRE